MSFCCPPYVCIAVHAICASSFNSIYFLFVFVFIACSEWLFAPLSSLHYDLLLLPSLSHWVQFVCSYAIMPMRKLNSYNVLYCIYYSYNPHIHFQCFSLDVFIVNKWSKHSICHQWWLYFWQVQSLVIIMLHFLHVGYKYCQCLYFLCIYHYQIALFKWNSIALFSVWINFWLILPFFFIYSFIPVRLIPFCSRWKGTVPFYAIHDYLLAHQYRTQLTFGFLHLNFCSWLLFVGRKVSLFSLSLSRSSRPPTPRNHKY